MDNDLSSAKALYEQMQTEGVPANELSLKRLAMLYKNKGETVPFTEPPVSHAPLREVEPGTGRGKVGTDREIVWSQLLNPPN